MDYILNDVKEDVSTGITEEEVPDKKREKKEKPVKDKKPSSKAAANLKAVRSAFKRKEIS